MSGPERKARRLEQRVAIWLAVTSVFSVLVFAVAVMLSLALEASEEQDEGLRAAAANEGESALEEGSESVFWAMLIAAPVGVAVSVAGAMVVSRRAFAPLRELTLAAKEIDIADLNRRLLSDSKHLDRELDELVSAFNDLLARLESSTRALDDYASEVSHELRTPLATAILSIEVALRKPRTPEQWRDKAGTVLKELQLMANLVDSLLCMARARSGAGVEKRAFRVADELETVRARAQRIAIEKSIVMHWQLGEQANAANMFGAPDLLATAVWNLLSNALEHTPAQGVVRVQIDASGEARDASVLRICVDDSGTGLGTSPPPSTEKKYQSGLGIGLPLVRRIAELHGGTLASGTSDLGGASFSLNLLRYPA